MSEPRSLAFSALDKRTLAAQSRTRIDMQGDVRLHVQPHCARTIVWSTGSFKGRFLLGVLDMAMSLIEMHTDSLGTRYQTVQTYDTLITRIFGVLELCRPRERK